jgi:hypothetical protein
MGRLALIARLVGRDLRHRPAEAILLLLAITAAATSLTIGLVLHGVTSGPYERTRAATAGPDMVADAQPGLNPDQAVNPASLLALAKAHGVTASSGPFPLLGMTVCANGYTVPAMSEGRDQAPSAVDRPLLTAGTWAAPGPWCWNAASPRPLAWGQDKPSPSTNVRSSSPVSPSRPRCPRIRRCALSPYATSPRWSRASPASSGWRRRTCSPWPGRRTRAGAILGTPLGILLYGAVKHGSTMTYPPAWWLACVVIATPLAAGALTVIPARAAARAGLAPVLQSGAT